MVGQITGLGRQLVIGDGRQDLGQALRLIWRRQVGALDFVVKEVGPSSWRSIPIGRQRGGLAHTGGFQRGV